jgi:hypothetical protein
MSLLTVYKKTDQQIDDEAAGFTVPPPILRLSGDLVLLRVLNDEDLSPRWYSVTADDVQSKLFGNPIEHEMSEYRARIYRLLGEVPPREPINL